MRLILRRFRDDGTTTQGMLYLQPDVTPPIKPAPKFMCFTLEDTHRDKKVKHQTRIPAGVYEIKLRTEGGFHEKYRRKYPFHKGMLWIQNVPGFEFILIHLGNDSEDTSGCILVGNIVDASNPKFIGASGEAYVKLYQELIPAFERGERVEICVVDEA